MNGPFDIAIVGGGMVGASLAVALEHLGVTHGAHRGGASRCGVAAELR